jgi:signal transduction histidine kinase
MRARLLIRCEKRDEGLAILDALDAGKWKNLDLDLEVTGVRALALDLPITVDVDIQLPARLDAPVESAGYFAVAESLANVVKHSGAGHAWVHIRHEDGKLRMQIVDDGRGGADIGAGSGLSGIQKRLAAFDGTLIVTSPLGGPTVVTMEVPCALSSEKTLPS